MEIRHILCLAALVAQAEEIPDMPTTYRAAPSAVIAAAAQATPERFPDADCGILLNRRPLAALALTTDTSTLTAIGNDFSFAEIFAKQIEALGKPEDLALGISTSGNSENVLLGIQAARRIGMRCAALTGGQPPKTPGGKLGPLCDILLNVPASETPQIQECHLFIEHLLCELVERDLFQQD